MNVVHDFIDEEIEDGEVAEIVVVGCALLLMDHHHKCYFFLIKLVYFFSFLYSFLFCFWTGIADET